MWTIKSSAFSPWTEGYHSDSKHLLKFTSSGLSFQMLYWVFLKVLQWRLSLIFCLSVSDIKSMKILSTCLTVSHVWKLCFDSFRWYGNMKICDVSFNLMKYRKKLSILHFGENSVLFKFSLSLLSVEDSELNVSSSLSVFLGVLLSR